MEKILSFIWKDLAEGEEEDEVSGEGLPIFVNDHLQDGKLYVRKDGRCYHVQKAQGDGLFISPRPPYLPSGIDGDGLFLQQNGGKIYSGEGLLFGANSPFKNVTILGLLL